ncbi:hypothetical protein JOL79_21040 [Microbispora sp. RL4-1S]|uniref:Uncharacterized protein n=1 Tax=Microbispora oryzae TaxID=2806554 RepID=A0A941AJG0_9ACTN|nr:hypothetical protein [Microbispora oryzae]MBP2706300.1 hypothetical protein [Microbispora oryzae]
MGSRARRAWIAVGGAFTAISVIVVAFAISDGIRVGHGFGGRSGPPPPRVMKTELSSRAYSLLASVVVVEAAGRTSVRVLPGPPGRLSVLRELTWYDDDRGGDLKETWENGRKLSVDLDCPRDECHATYTLTVPSGTRVEMRTPDGERSCLSEECAAQAAPAPPSPEVPPSAAPSPKAPSPAAPPSAAPLPDAPSPGTV